MEIIQHNKQITKGSVLVCIQDAAFGVKRDEVLKVTETKGTDKVKFTVHGFMFLQGPVLYRFRKAYKNGQRLCFKEPENVLAE